jgi:hypothetical protein
MCARKPFRTHKKRASKHKQDAEYLLHAMIEHASEMTEMKDVHSATTSTKELDP